MENRPLPERDLGLLDFAAQHRLILAGQAQKLLGISASAAERRLRALTRDGYMVARRIFVGQAACYQITRSGLIAVGSALPVPRFDVRGYTHDVGVAWLWLAARSGALGPQKEVLAERALRSFDARKQTHAFRQPFGVRLGGIDDQGRERLHYPDLLLVTSEGTRVALELELSPKARTRRERILAGYGSDARISAVLYLVDQRGVAQATRASARRLGIDSLVHVQWVRQTQIPAGLAAASAAELRPSSTQRTSRCQAAQR